MLRSLFRDCGCPRGAVGKLLLSMMNRGHRTLHEWGLEIASPAPDARALDIGCGGGSTLALLLRRCRAGMVCGIDVSECGIECSRRRNAKAVDAGRCEVRAGSAEAVPYPDGYFDLATAFETLYFWPDLDAAFREIFRVLKPGGMFLAANEQSEAEGCIWTEIVDNMTIHGEEEITSRLARAGFTDIRACHGKGSALCVTAKKPLPA